MTTSSAPALTKVAPGEYAPPAPAAAAEVTALRGARPLSVGVVVDLVWGPWAGGHVKCWERLAAAAAAFPRDIDLTVHFLGEQRGVVEVAPNARYCLHRPVLNTKWLGFTQNPQNHTCLAPVHPGLAAELGAHDVLHATGAFFSLAKTALRHSRRRGIPLVYSFHTDTVSYTRHFSKEILRRWFGDGAILRFMVDTVRWPDRSGDRMQHLLDGYLRQCDWVLASKPEDREAAERVVPGKRLSYLRRGVDRDVFSPSRRDRQRLQAAHGIAADKFVVIFVGRVDDAKNVMTLANAVRRLRDGGKPVHLLMAGTGERAQDIRALLGQAVTAAGQVDPDTLGWLYASADLFAFPSELEIMPNVVNEARACGLPALVAQGGGAAGMVDRPGVDALCLPGREEGAWAAAIGGLMADGERRRALGEGGLRYVNSRLPGWEDVLFQDLIPIWRRVLEARRVAEERRAFAPA